MVAKLTPMEFLAKDWLNGVGSSLFMLMEDHGDGTPVVGLDFCHTWFLSLKVGVIMHLFIMIKIERPEFGRLSFRN